MAMGSATLLVLCCLAIAAGCVAAYAVTGFAPDRGDGSDRGGGGDASGSAPGKRYTITFDSQGGSPVPSIVGVAEGSKITEPLSPVKDGCEFRGWYRSSEFVTKWDFSNTVYGNITLYAKWNGNYDVEKMSGHKTTLDTRSDPGLLVQYPPWADASKSPADGGMGG